MSFSLDTNLLLYASDASSPHQERARDFLERCMRGPEVCYLTWPTLMAYLRISTHPSIFAAPLSPEEAESNVGTLIALSHVRVLTEGPGIWTRYCVLASEVPLRGNLVPNAHIAALLLAHGIRRLFTRNRDFLKFPDLIVTDPLVDG